MDTITGAVQWVSFAPGSGGHDSVWLDVSQVGADGHPTSQPVILFPAAPQSRVRFDGADVSFTELLLNLSGHRCTVTAYPDVQRYGACYRADFVTIPPAPKG